MIAFFLLSLRVKLLHRFLSHVLSLLHLSGLSIYTQVDIMHEERFSVRRSSSIVLTWNIAAMCQGMDKDWKQLLHCGKAIVSVTTWFEMQLNTKHTLYIKSTPLVRLVKGRLVPVNRWCISLWENFSKALPLHIKEGSLQKCCLDCHELLLCGPAVFEGSVWFGLVVCRPPDGQHWPVSCEAPLWQITRPGVAAQLGRHGEELPYSSGKTTTHCWIKCLFHFPHNLNVCETVERQRMRHLNMPAEDLYMSVIHVFMFMPGKNRSTTIILLNSFGPVCCVCKMWKPKMTSSTQMIDWF